MAPQTTHFSYDFYKDKPTDLIYQVDTHYPSETPVLRLTKTNDQDVPQERSTGRVLYSKTVPFGHTADFTTTVQFIIRPNSPPPSQADGLAFFIVPVGHNFPSQIGGNLGLFEPSPSKSPHVFAIAFDTYSDDPNYVYLGIDIESRNSPPKAQVPISFVGKELTLKVSYVASTKTINASVTDGSQDFPVTFAFDLSQILPPAFKSGSPPPPVITSQFTTSTPGSSLLPSRDGPHFSVACCSKSIYV